MKAVRIPFRGGKPSEPASSAPATAEAAAPVPAEQPVKTIEGSKLGVQQEKINVPQQTVDTYQQKLDYLVAQIEATQKMTNPIPIPEEYKRLLELAKSDKWNTLLDTGEGWALATAVLEREAFLRLAAIKQNIVTTFITTESVEQITKRINPTGPDSTPSTYPVDVAELKQTFLQWTKDHPKEAIAIGIVTGTTGFAAGTGIGVATGGLGLLVEGPLVAAGAGFMGYQIGGGGIALLTMQRLYKALNAENPDITEIKRTIGQLDAIAKTAIPEEYLPYIEYIAPKIDIQDTQRFAYEVAEAKADFYESLGYPKDTLRKHMPWQRKIAYTIQKRGNFTKRMVQFFGVKMEDSAIPHDELKGELPIGEGLGEHYFSEGVIWDLVRLREHHARQYNEEQQNLGRSIRASENYHQAYAEISRRTIGELLDQILPRLTPDKAKTYVGKLKTETGKLSSAVATSANPDTPGTDSQKNITTRIEYLKHVKANEKQQDDQNKLTKIQAEIVVYLRNNGNEVAIADRINQHQTRITELQTNIATINKKRELNTTKRERNEQKYEDLSTRQTEINKRIRELEQKEKQKKITDDEKNELSRISNELNESITPLLTKLQPIIDQYQEEIDNLTSYTIELVKKQELLKEEQQKLEALEKLQQDQKELQEKVTRGETEETINKDVIKLETINQSLDRISNVVGGTITNGEVTGQTGVKFFEALTDTTKQSEPLPKTEDEKQQTEQPEPQYEAGYLFILDQLFHYQSAPNRKAVFEHATAILPPNEWARLIFETIHPSGADFVPAFQTDGKFDLTKVLNDCRNQNNIGKLSRVDFAHAYLRVADYLYTKAMKI